MNNIGDYNMIIKRLSEIPTSTKMIIESFSIFSFCESWKSWVAAIILATLIMVGIDFSNSSLLLTIVSKVLDIELSIFAVLITIYSIVLIFLSDDFIRIMINIEVDNTRLNKSLFESYVYYLGHILFMYFLGLICTILLFFSITITVQMVNPPQIPTCLISLLYFLYFLFSVRLIWELKSVIYNVISIFRMSLVIRISLLEQHKCKK